MDLFEYQGLALLARHGLPVPEGIVATTPGEAVRAATRTGFPVVLKAQVKTGGRGKAGGVVLAADSDQVLSSAQRLLGMHIHDHPVDVVLVTPAATIAEEYYVSFALDRTSRGFVCIASAEGGMDIEQVARENPAAVARTAIDPTRGVDSEVAAGIVARAGFPPQVRSAVADCVVRLWEALVAEDATLVEINPLARLADGSVRCLDAKVTIDDNAVFRHPETGSLGGETLHDPVERLAAAHNLNYVRLDGQVGIIGNGAGLVMSTLDVVAQVGADWGVRPANFLDIGGGASEGVMVDALTTVLADPSVRVVLINVFGGITACDQVAAGILRSVEIMEERDTPLRVPVVVRLDGNRAEEGRRLLMQADHPGVEQSPTMDGAARRAAELVGMGNS